MSDFDFSAIEEAKEKKVREARSELSDNKVEDLVRYSRGNVIRNEEQFTLLTLGWLTGWMAEPEYYVNTLVVGTSSSGKTHMVDKARDLLPRGISYRSTSSSDKGFIDDPRWSGTKVAPLDELNKLGSDLIEYMKSVADRKPYVYVRSMQSKSAKGGRESVELKKEPKPFSFQSAQFNHDFELWNRMLKVYVDESEAIHRAIGRRHSGHQMIKVSPDDDREYIFETDDLRDALRSHISAIPEDSHVDLPEWVWYVMEPIFNHSRTEVNRVYAMVFNLIRASALLNYDSREGSGSADDPFLANEQDVANVLACRETLLGTTHELEPRKLAIIEAIRAKSGLGEGQGAPIQDINDYLASSQTDSVQLKKTQVRNLLEELDENYIIETHEDTKPYIYEFKTMSGIGTPRINEKPELGEAEDPIRKQQLKLTVEDFRKWMNSGQDLEGVSEDEDAAEKQKDLMGNDEVVLDLTDAERAVHEAMKDAIDDTVVDMEELQTPHMVGAVEYPDGVAEADTSDTLLDPDHDFWDRPDEPGDWVSDESDTEQELSSIVRDLKKKGAWTAESDGATDSHYKIKVRSA